MKTTSQVERIRRARNIIASELALSEMEANSIVLALQHAGESAEYAAQYGTFNQELVRGVLGQLNKF